MNPKKGTRLLAVWIINALALLALPYLTSSVSVPTLSTALVAALVLGLINTFIRPILIILTLPVTLITLGIFIFVLNAFLFMLVAWLVPSFGVAGFWSALWGSILYSILSWALTTIFLDSKK